MTPSSGRGGLPFVPPDYSVLDDPVLARFVFYPRPDRRPAPPHAADVGVETEDGVTLGGRFYAADPLGPSILYFHGNGEVASDYDDVAPLYAEMGASLFVADYRGYGKSAGAPTFPNMLADAHAFYRAFAHLMEELGYGGRRYVMGRSLGGHSAVELAAHYSDGLSGLIVESGVTGVSRFAGWLAERGKAAEAVELEARHLEKVRSIRVPVLLLHGALDDMVAVENAQLLYDSLAVEDKHLVVLPGAGHNDIMWVGQREYFGALGRFVGRG